VIASSDMAERPPCRSVVQVSAVAGGAAFAAEDAHLLEQFVLAYGFGDLGQARGGDGVAAAIGLGQDSEGVVAGVVCAGVADRDVE
jgi:hypothetical protein